MNKETLRMQMLAGIITESQYKAKLNESIQPIIIDADEAIELDFSDPGEVSLIFDTPEYEGENNDAWADLRFSVSIDIDIIQEFLRDQSKTEITVPVMDGYGIVKLDKDYAESIMDSFYGNYPHLDPTDPDYEGEFGFGLNEIKVNNPLEDKHIIANYNTNGGTSEVKFARVLADNVMAGYNKGDINGLYSEGEMDINGDEFYASLDMSKKVFASLPNTFTITADLIDEEPFTFKVTKNGKLGYIAEEI